MRSYLKKVFSIFIKTLRIIKRILSAELLAKTYILLSPASNLQKKVILLKVLE